MSEDCHDSNNENPFRVTRGDMSPDGGTPEIMLACAECGEPVRAEESYPVELEHFDGTSEVAVFHKDFARSCPLKWSVKRLEAAGEKLRKILDIYESLRKPDASSGL
jgi:hypothetical protein